MFQTKLCFPKGQKLSIVISIPYGFLLLLYILKIPPPSADQMSLHFSSLEITLEADC